LRLEAALRGLPYVLLLLAGAGLLISIYLVTTHYGHQPIACGGVGDCEAVNSSEYAKIGGIPVSLLGVGLYGSLFVTALAWIKGPSDDKRMVAFWGLSLSGAGYAAYLTYVELTILDAICIWCVTSATILTMSFIVASAAVFLQPED